MQSGIHKEGVLGLFVYNSYQLVCSNKHVIKKMFDLIFAAHKGYKNLRGISYVYLIGTTFQCLLSDKLGTL